MRSSNEYLASKVRRRRGAATVLETRLGEEHPKPRAHGDTSPSRFLWPVLVGLIVGAFALGLGMARAQVVCDRDVKVNKADALSYRRRGNRCEGRVVRPFGQQALEVASFTLGKVPSDLLGRTDLVVLDWAWPYVGAEVRFHGRGIRADLVNYRLDAQFSSAEGSVAEFAWPQNIVTALDVPQIRWGDIGLVAWFQADNVAPGLPSEALVPFWPKGPTPGGAREYSLVLRMHRRISQAWMSIRPVEPSGQLAEDPIVRYQPIVEPGDYSGLAVAVNIPFSSLRDPGLYLVSIFVRGDLGGEEPALQRVIYHAF